MSDFIYVPDQEIEIHREQAIRLLITDFSSHEDGLPEWIKNASDQYAREDTPEDKRIIVVMFDYGHRNAKPSIAVVDFSGMTSEVIELNFRVWFDPEAAHRGASRTARQRQGGHGNGGKSYMCNMFEDFALLETVRNGRGCKYGVKGGTVTFGYVPNPTDGRNYSVPDLREELTRVLSEVHCTFAQLPAEAQVAFTKSGGYTFVRGVGPKYCDNRIPYQDLVKNLEGHPQMIQPLEFCKVFVLVNGQLFEKGRRLTVPRIAPIEGAELPREIAVPEELADRETGQHISTTQNGTKAPGTLRLLTSAKDMRWNKFRHVVSFRAESGWIGYVPVTELDTETVYRNKIYGDCYLQVLEPFKQNDRARLARSPLTRAVESFIADQIDIYGKEFEARDKRTISARERSELSKINEALDRWKNKLIDKALRGIWGRSNDDAPVSHPVLPTGTPVRIEISNVRRYAGRGISFRPRLRFFDAQGRQVRSVPYSWFSENTNVALVDEKLNVIQTFAHGNTKVWVATTDNRLRSDRLDLDVIRIRDIRIEPEETALPQGSRTQLKATCRLSSGQETDDVFLAWLSNDESVATVSAAGLVFGHGIGSTEVAAQDEDSDPSLVKVVVTEPIPKESSRSRYPRILVSETDADPETGEPRVLSSADPPVYQSAEDSDRNIWWINSAAPLARLYSDTQLNYGYNSEAWRMYHVERYVEIISQIRLIHGPESVDQMSVNEWIFKWGESIAEIQQAVVAGLKEFIANGTLPEE